MAGKIFINYRQGDSIGMAGRLHDRLMQTFGRDNLFVDVDQPVGVDFATHLNDQVAACDVMLVVIGPNWLRAKDKAGQRRLHQPDDFVAIEITAALARDISVIPVLVERARMPRASELPDALKLLARRQAAEIRHASFGRDAKALVARMCEALGTPIAEAQTAGVIEPEERAMIAGVMRLGDRPVRAVMTPRPNVEMIDLSEGLEQVRRRMMDSVHSRFPVHDRSPDEILGVLQVRDVLVASVRGERPDLHALVRAAPVVADTVDALDVVDIMKRSIVHMALVHDEYGHFEGIVTSADILEAIVGDFQTDKGPPEPDVVQREDGSWLISGSMPLDEVAERLSIQLPPQRAYHSAAGFVLHQIGHLPAVGEGVDVQGWRFEIVDPDGRRIDKILASRIRVGRRRRAV